MMTRKTDKLRYINITLKRSYWKKSDILSVYRAFLNGLYSHDQTKKGLIKTIDWYADIFLSVEELDNLVAYLENMEDERKNGKKNN